ncbi:MAG: iron ABC transporter permease [Candidatus Heimdallarchaeota archaeon]|nr:iron ABC transporter permease [Candidatus Heimdallarchaeota archaeon]MDH5644505.1 iron ABC transporter permease [Candidatus Heimdallarchaeota archaeon]
MSSLDDIRKRYLNFERILSQRPIRILFEILVIFAFFSFVLLPPLNLLKNIITDWNSITELIFRDPILKNTVWLSMFRSIALSFRIAFIVMIIDIMLGIPIAHVLARYDFKGKTIIDTIIDLPLAVPTSALGFSVLLFWGSADGLSKFILAEEGIFSQGPMLLLLGHVAFSFSYVVRNLKGVIEEVDVEIENAARTLGAPPISVFRTITAPMAKEGIIAGAILAFTRSLGETGASLLLAGVYETAPIQIVTFMNGYRIPQAAFLSVILIIISITLLGGVRQYARKVGLPQPKIYPEFERKISAKKIAKTRNGIVSFIFLLLVLIPALFVIFYLIDVWSIGPSGTEEDSAFFEVFLDSDNKWESMQVALITSVEVALIVTIINLSLGIPMAYLLVRRPYWGKWKVVLDMAIDIPLVIPSSALGFAVYLLWGNLGLKLISPGIWLIVLAHLTFTYPFSVRPMINYIENFDYSYYEAGRTLGASDLTTFRRVVFPMLKRGILSSAILTFTRSMAETGATLIVMGNARTVPVFIVDLVESESLSSAAFAAVLLIFISFILLLVVRLVDNPTED